MFKPIETSDLKSNQLVLGYFEFSKYGSTHVEKMNIIRDEQGKVIDYILADGNKLNIKGLPSDYMEIPSADAFTILNDDLSNAPLNEDVLIKFSDGSIENATFEEVEGGVIYILFDGEALIHNPTHFMKMPKFEEIK